MHQAAPGEREREMGNNDSLPLFVTKSAKGRILFQFYALSIFVGICLIFVHRLTHIPEEKEAGRWAWMGLFLSEFWFCFYWFFSKFPLYINWSFYKK